MSSLLATCLAAATLGVVARLCAVAELPLAESVAMATALGLPSLVWVGFRLRRAATGSGLVPSLALAALVPIALVLAWARGWIGGVADRPFDATFYENGVLTGWIAAEVIRRPAPARGGTRFPVRIEGGFRPDLTGRSVSLWADSSSGVPREGSEIVTFVELNRPAPGSTPGAFDVRSWMVSLGVAAIGTVRARAWRESESPGFHPRRPLEELRDRASRRLAVLVPGESGGFLRGLLLGERGRVAPEVIDDFRRAGVLHLLALSGQHVLLVAALLQFLVRWTPLGKDARTGLAAVGVWLYAVGTGASPSVTRASTGATLHGLASLLRRVPNGFEILAWSATIGMLLSPRLGAHVGFQLSCLASAGLLLVAASYGAVRERLESRTLRLLWRAASLPLATLGAQLAVLPLLGLHFGVVSGVALVSNVFVVPCCAVLLTMALPLLALDFLFPVPHFLWHAIAGLAGFTLTLGEAFASLPGTRLACDFTTAGALGALALFALATIGLAQWARARRTALPTRSDLVLSALGWCALGGWGATIVLSFQPNPPRLESDALYWMLDVGQGDAQVLELASGEVWVVDVGDRRPGYDAGARVLVPFLRARGHRAVTGVVLTHEDRDHAGGWQSLARDVPVGELVSGQETLTALIERGALGEVPTPLRVISQGSALREGSAVQFRVLWPPSGETGLAANDRSVVLEVALAGTRMVLPGDVDSTAERSWLEGVRGPIDYLKLAHHGSGSSSCEALVRRASGGVALVSSGRSNRFGHPHDATLARAERYGLHVRRTDREGSVCIALGARRVRPAFATRLHTPYR